MTRAAFPRKRRRKMSTSRKIAWGICALSVAAAAALFIIFGMVKLSFQLPNADAVDDYALAGRSVTAPAAPVYEGYVFLGWQSEEGELSAGDSVSAYRDTVFSPVYTVALKETEHPQYIFPDDTGFFRPYEEMTRGDAARMLYALLSVDVEPTGNYADVDASAPYAEATAALYHLQVTDDLCFYPQEPLRLGELLTMLAKFYPGTQARYDIADVSKQNSAYQAYCLAIEKGWAELDSEGRMEPGRTLSRIQVCVLMNKVLGRSADQEALPKLRGIIPDMSPKAEGYADVAEAAFGHEYAMDGGAEHYTSQLRVKKLSQGFYQVGADLYYIGKDGLALTESSVGSLYFGADGKYTSGIKELDVEINKVLDKVLKSSMEPLERLRAVYDYTVSGFEYQRQDAMRSGATGWEKQQALDMFTTGRGNCYSYAAAFCMLARAVGYDAQAKAGTVDAINSAHGWVEIEIDGVLYMFDPELEMTCLYNNGEKLDRFMFPTDDTGAWTYSTD